MNQPDTLCQEGLRAPTSSADDDALSPEVGRLCRLLRQAPMFRSLGCDEIARFARGVREIKLAFTSSEGNEKVVDILRTGQSFGEAVMFMDKPYVVMAQALADSTLLHIGKQVFFEEMNNDPLFCRRIIAGLAQRLHRLMGDVESYSLRSGRERIIGYLLREEETIGDAASVGRVSIRLPTSKGTIASRLNLTQEHFSRILNELTSSGLIEVEGRTIHIPDIGRLRCNVE